MIRVLVVDDSAFARKVIRDILAGAEGIEVVDIARDGLDALERIQALRPDVITLDLVMPHLDGLGVLRALPATGAPRVLVVSSSDAESDLGLEALDLGAIDVIAKPTALATERLYDLRTELVAKVEAAAGARPLVALPRAPLAAPAGAGKVELVAVGTSTGGPPALTRLLAALPADLPVPVVVALHIPAGFTEALARRLDRVCAIAVREAADGMELSPGMAAIAPGGTQMQVQRSGGRLLAGVSGRPAGMPHAPSVDVLFTSVAETLGSRGLGVVLTGMGDDGLVGAGAIQRAGGSLLTESPESCVVYGMPRVVVDAGLSSGAASIDEMASLILSRL
jgi:two-component system chemotaxis response regulator CheB